MTVLFHLCFDPVSFSFSNHDQILEEGGYESGPGEGDAIKSTTLPIKVGWGLTRPTPCRKQEPPFHLVYLCPQTPK